MLMADEQHDQNRKKDREAATESDVRGMPPVSAVAPPRQQAVDQHGEACATEN